MLYAPRLQVTGHHSPWAAEQFGERLDLSGLSRFHVGALVTMTGLLGISAMVFGIGLSGLLGIADDDAGLLGYVGMAMGGGGIILTSCGLVPLGVGTLRGAVLPGPVRGLPLAGAAILPVGMAVVGAAEGAFEAVAFIAMMATFTALWVVLGVAAAVTDRPHSVAGAPESP